MSSAVGWSAFLVSLSVLLAFLGQLIKLGYRQVRNHEKTQEQVGELTKAVKGLLEGFTTFGSRVDQLERLLNNGLRTEVRAAGEAANRAVEMGQANGREIQALRAEVDIYTNAVIDDRRRIRAIVKDATGIDIADA